MHLQMLCRNFRYKLSNFCNDHVIKIDLKNKGISTVCFITIDTFVSTVIGNTTVSISGAPIVSMLFLVIFIFVSVRLQMSDTN